MVKKLLIDKMPGKYFLSSHPYPKIEGEMFIIKPKKQDQSSKDAIIYRDYSLCKRIETTPGRVNSAEQARKQLRAFKDRDDDDSKARSFEPEAKL
mmetsp:Transcript_34344/g.42397  ORF Transcript_34344/g.42397 Transcript_34344/m.42397 type:complete len:95 (-) Transcript_34344:912-1196(-)